MKKCLVLLMVLGIASMATAGLSFATGSATVPIGGSVVVALTTDAVEADGSLTNIVGYYAGSVASISVAAGADTVAQQVNAMGGAYVGYYQTIMGTTAGGGFAVGDEIAVVTLTGNAAGVYTINAWEAWTSPPGPTDSFTLTVTPEPMTIGLLGLGGLFLRRRK